MWTEYKNQVRSMEKVICEELLCITESPSSRRTVQNEELYWDNVLYLPSIKADNLTTMLDVLDGVKTQRSVPSNISFRLVDLTSPEVVQFRNTLRPECITPPVLDFNKGVNFDSVVDLICCGSSFHLPQSCEPILDQCALQETKLTLMPYLALKDAIPVDDLEDNSFQQAISTKLTKIQTPNELRTEPCVFGELLFDEVRSCSVSFVDVPLIHDPFSCDTTADIYSMLFQEATKNQSMKQIEFEHQTECNEDQFSGYLGKCLDFEEVIIDDTNNGVSDSFIRELISVVSENTNAILISPSDFVCGSLELDDLMNEFKEEELLDPQDLTADSFVDLLSKRLELSCSDLTLPPVFVPSLDQVLSHDMDRCVPKEYLQPCPINDPILNWNITQQEFSPVLSEDSRLYELTSIASDAMISLFKSHTFPGSSKQRLCIQNSKFTMDPEDHSPRMEQERPVKRSKVNGTDNMEFFMKLKSRSANKSSPQRGPINRLQVIIQEVEPSSLMKRILNIISVKYEHILNSLPLNLKSKWNGVKLLDPLPQVSSNSGASSTHTSCLTEMLDILGQMAVAVLDTGPVATINQFMQNIHSSLEANADIRGVLSEIHTCVKEDANFTLDPRLEYIGEITSDAASKDARFVILMDQALHDEFLPILKQCYSLQCCQMKSYGTPLWKTSSCLLISNQDLITPDSQQQCSEFFIHCTTLIEVCNIRGQTLLDQSSWLSQSRLESLGVRHLIQLKIKVPSLEVEISKSMTQVDVQHQAIPVIVNRRFCHDHDALYLHMMHLERQGVIALSERSCVCDIILPLSSGILIFGPLFSGDTNLVQEYANKIEKSAKFCTKITVFLNCSEETFDRVIQCWSPLRKRLIASGVVMCINHSSYFQQYIDESIKELDHESVECSFMVPGFENRVEKMMNNSGCFSPFVSFLLSEELINSGSTRDPNQVNDSDLQKAKEELSEHWEFWHQSSSAKWKSIGDIQKSGFEEFNHLVSRTHSIERTPSQRSSSANSASLQCSDRGSSHCSSSSSRLKETKRLDLEQYRFVPRSQTSRDDDNDDEFVSLFEDFDDLWNAELTDSEDQGMFDSSSTALNTFPEISGLNDSLSSDFQSSMESCLRPQQEQEEEEAVKAPSFRSLIQRRSQKTTNEHQTRKTPKKTTQTGRKRLLFPDYSALKRTSKNPVSFQLRNASI